MIAMRLSHARDSSTVRPLREKFIIKSALVAEKESGIDPAIKQKGGKKSIQITGGVSGHVSTGNVTDGKTKARKPKSR